jgi:hypothetical protein
MRKFLFLSGIVTFVFSACSEYDTEMVTYSVNEPVFMSGSEFRNSVKVKSEAQTISDYGKICYYEGFLFISESEKGIHIIDNRNPSNPAKVGFIELLGNADLSVRNNKLYADSYIDLVWFDISNPANPSLEGRLENVFPYAFPSVDDDIACDYTMIYNDENKDNIVVGWSPKLRTETVTHHNDRWRWWKDLFGGSEKEYAVMDNAGGGSSTGVGGSMSKFTIYDDYLYTVLNSQMNIFDLRTDKPEQVAENIYLVNSVETIFSYKDNLFMGTPTGMVIYSVKDPLKPESQSMIWHAFGCDPVVVENDIAYVTVHSGNTCGQNNNDLIIVDVSDVKSPRHIVTYAMTRPKGLGIDNGTLFLCDEGLKIYDAANPQTLMANRLAHYAGMEGYDVIPFKNVLMMIAEDGLYQYDYSDLTEIKQLSKLSIGKE